MICIRDVVLNNITLDRGSKREIRAGPPARGPLNPESETQTLEQGGIYGIGLQIDTNPPYPVIKPPTRLTDVSGLNLINDKVQVGDQLVKVRVEDLGFRVEG